MADTQPTSFRLPVDVMAALRLRGDQTGETVSDMLRQGALMLLGVCPTCGQKVPVAAPEEGVPGA